MLTILTPAHIATGYVNVGSFIYTTQESHTPLFQQIPSTPNLLSQLKCITFTE